MIVGVESNFVLELTFRQEDVGHCTRILALAEQEAIQLVIPACALFEPYETLIRHAKERGKVTQELRTELQQLARTDTYSELREASAIVMHALTESAEEQRVSLAQTIDRLVRVATVIPLDANVIKCARIVQIGHRFPAQDSVVFASIDRFFAEQGNEPKLFANKNHKDFEKNWVERQLAKHNCKLLPKFSQAREYIEGSLRLRS